LKYIWGHYYTNHALSPLTQGRGLKSSTGGAYGAAIVVAPHAGAWIEIATGVMLE